MTRQEIKAEIKRLRPHAEYDSSVWAQIENLSQKLERLETEETTTQCDRCGKPCSEQGYKDGQTGRPICDTCADSEWGRCC